MLIRFRVANFRSLRDEQELSLVAATRKDRPDLIRVEGLGVDLLRVAGIYGANAAGKSNVIAAFRFMQEAVVDSRREWGPRDPIPREPFLLDGQASSQPSLFAAEILVGGVCFQYGFVLDDESVLEEWLYAFPKNRRQVWFTRDSLSFTFGKHLKGANRFLGALTRKNSLFLSVAADHNHELLSPVYDWFARGLVVAGRERRDPLHLTEAVFAKEGGRGAMLDLLRLADLGIVDVDLKRSPGGEGRGHQEFEFAHKGREELRFPLAKESQGTREWFSLTGPVLHALEVGALLCIDELDASLHPRLSLELVRMFQDPARNPRNAQLLFNTHDTTLLGTLLRGPALQRDQVWFVEKDQSGASHLYALSDFKPRKLENVERGYLVGRYGGIPYIRSQVLDA